MPSHLLPFQLPSDTITRLLALRISEEESLAAVINRLARNETSHAAMTPAANGRQQSAAAAQPPNGKYGYELLGETGAADTLGKLLVDVLRRLSQLDAAFLTRYSQREGRSRRFLARDPRAIYPGREDLSEYTTEVCQGWWVGTNYSRKDVCRLLRAACQVAGLIWEVDFKLQF